jgi:hypothetical protein
MSVSSSIIWLWIIREWSVPPTRAACKVARIGRHR